MQGNDGVVVVIFAGKQGLHADVLILGDELIHVCLDIRQNSRVIFLITHLDEKLDLLEKLRQMMIDRDIVLQAFQSLHALLGFLRVIPEIRLLHFSLKLLNSLLFVYQIQRILDFLQGLLVCAQSVFKLV